VYIHLSPFIYTKEISMAGTLTSIRLDTKLADEAVRVLGVKSRTEAVHVALKEAVGNKRFKELMIKNGGKMKFAGSDE
jgi:Arc/MetJ family transcription regulator